MRRQQVRHAADFAPAHRIGLAGERQRRGARLADLAGRQMQVDQRGILVDAAGGLIQPLAIQRQGRPGGEPARGLHDIGGTHPADRRHFLRRVFAHGGAQGFPAFGVRGDVVAVDQFLPQHHVQHGVEQRHVGAGQDRQVQVGFRCGIGAARVDHDQFEFGIVFTRRLDAAKQDGMGVGGIRPGDENHPRVVDVFITAGRRIGAQGRLVAGHRGRHAQARIGVDVVGADQPLGQLVEDVVVLGGELAGDIEAHRIRPVFANDGGECVCRMVERRVPAHPLARGGALRAQFGTRARPDACADRCRVAPLVHSLP